MAIRVGDLEIRQSGNGGSPVANLATTASFVPLFTKAARRAGAEGSIAISCGAVELWRGSMANAFGLLITGLLLVTGAVGIVSPGTLCDLESGVDVPPGPPSELRLRQMRIQCVVMVVMACIGIYAILTAVGPADGPLF